MTDQLDRLYDLITEPADTEKVKSAVQELLNSGEDPDDIIGTINEALDEVGTKYKSGEFFLSDLMMAGSSASEATGLLDLYIEESGRKKKGKVVIGTVEGDIHNIGKDINILMLKSEGFEVVDLGVDIPARDFVENVKKEKPDVLGISALLTSTMTKAEEVINALEEAGLREEVKIIIGGRPVNEKFAEEIDADGYAEDAVDGLKTIKSLTQGGN